MDFVLKDNGAYDPTAMKNAVRGGRNGNKAAKKDTRENKAGKDAREKRRGRSNADHKRQSLEAELIAEPMTTETAEDQPAKKHHRGGRKHRGASGEKLPPQPVQQAAQPRKAEGGRTERSDRSPRNGSGRGERSAQAGARPSDNRFGNSRGGRGRNREERRNGKEADYHRVYVTGLNSAVWPDPPGYHERKEREEATKVTTSKPSASRRPRPHRKTEGGTANSK